MPFSFDYDQVEAPKEEPRPSQSAAFLELDGVVRADKGKPAAWRAQDIQTFGFTDWPDIAEHTRLLDDLKPSAGEDRNLQALVRCRGLAVGATRANLWEDEEVRTALLLCAHGSQDAASLAQTDEPQTVRCVALGVILRTLAAQEYRAFILQNQAAREVIIRGLNKSQGEDVNYRAVLLFTGLLVEAVRTQSVHDYQDLVRAFQVLVGADEPVEHRETLFGAFWTSVISSGADVRKLWKNDSIQELVLQAADPEEASEEIRLVGIGCLWAMANHDEKMAEIIWQNGTARAAIITGAMSGQRIDIRRIATTALGNFSAQPQLREIMWNGVYEREERSAQDFALFGKPDEEPETLVEERLGEILLEGTEETQPMDIRLTCLRAIAELSHENAVQKSMAWIGPPGVHKILYLAYDEQTLPTRQRGYFRFAHHRIVRWAPETLVLAMVRDMLHDFLLGPKVSSSNQTSAMALDEGREEAEEESKIIDDIVEPELDAYSETSEKQQGEPTKIRSDNGFLDEEQGEPIKIGSENGLLEENEEQGEPIKIGSENGFLNDDEEQGKPIKIGSENGFLDEDAAEIVPEPDPVEFVDVGNVSRCIGARVRQVDAPDVREGCIVSVNPTTLDVSVKWKDSHYEPLVSGEIFYIDESKQGDPAGAPLPRDIEGFAIRSQHGRTGVIKVASRMKRTIGERQVPPLSVDIVWDIHVFTEIELGDGCSLAFITIPDLRLVSKSIREYVLPGPPPRSRTPPPEPEEEPPPPPVRMMGRREFEEEEDYIKYVKDLFKDHGGEVTARVAYYQDVPFYGIRKGMEGPIITWQNFHSFEVNWGGFENMWVDMSRCQLVKTADGAFIWTEEPPKPLYVGGGGISGPSADDAVIFENAEVPRTKAFTMMVKFRAKEARKKQHFVAWGSTDGTRKSVDLRLSESGNLEYGEHTGAMGSGWRQAEATPRIKLDDGIWHSVAVVKLDTGFVWLYCDGELVGQGFIGADLPRCLSAVAKSYRWTRQDFVFQGDLGPLQIFDSELTIGQVRTIDLFSGTPRFDVDT